MPHALKPTAQLPLPAVTDRAKAVTQHDAELDELALLICCSMTAAGVSCTQVAQAAEVSPSMVKAWRSPLSDKVPNWRHEERLRTRLPRLYDEIQRRRSQVCSPADDLGRAMLQVAKEYGELAEATLEALAEGRAEPQHAKRAARLAGRLVAKITEVQRAWEMVG